MTALQRTTLHTDQAPKALGPYSQAIRAGDFVFAAGQVGIDPATGDLVGGGITAQTRQVLRNIEKVLQAGGAGFANVIKTTIFLADMADFSAVNAIYAESFPKDPPARSTVAVAALPKGALVEIEVVAII